VGGLLEFNAQEASGGGVVNAIRLVDEDAQSEPFSLYLFNAKPTVVADADAFATAMTVADLRKLMAVVPIVAGDYVTLNSLTYVHLDLVSLLGHPLIFNSSAGLWGYLVPTATPDYAHADALWIGLDVVQG
jgi:hypothetical protein